MVTPLRERDQLDIPGLERLIEHILAGGVDALFILGTTGEGTSLSYRLRRDLIKRTCRHVRGRVPVLVGITDTAFVESVQLARHSATVGAEGLVVAPPYYLPGGQPELQQYLEHLIAELPLPLFLYNTPGLTKVQYELDTLQWAAEKPQVLGLKDSSRNMVYFQQALELRTQRPDWSLLIGPEELLAEAVLAGGHGGVPGGANMFPTLYVQLWQAAHTGDLPRTRQLHEEVMRVSDSLYHIGRHSSAVIKAIKCALACLGICDDFLAEPFHRFRAEERERVQRLLPDLAGRIDKALSGGTTPRSARVSGPSLSPARRPCRRSPLSP